MKKRKLIRSILVENGYGVTNNSKSLTFNGESFPYQIIDPVAFNSSSLLYFYNQDGYVVEASLNTIEPRNKFYKISGYDRLFAAGKSYWFDENKGYIVGDNTIIYTEDAGDTFVFRDCPTSVTNYGVYFVNENNGWICGESGTILKTTDSGINWVQQSSTTTQTLYSIYFHDSNSGISVGVGTILKTTNGGETWTGLSTLLRPINNPLTGSTITIPTLQNMQFYNSAVGYATGSGSYVLKTIDGGNTWLYVKLTATTLTYRGLCVKDENEVWVCGSNKEIWKTSDGGLNWTRKNNYTYETATISLIDIIFSGDTGYCFSSYASCLALKTTDNGETWDNITTSLTTSSSASIKMFNSNKLYRTGAGAYGITITNDGGDTWIGKIPENKTYSYWCNKISIIDENQFFFTGGLYGISEIY